MKTQMKSLAMAVSMTAWAGAAMAAELPVEEFPGGIEGDPTPSTPTFFADSAGRDLPAEEYPGGTGGQGDGYDVSLVAAGRAEENALFRTMAILNALLVGVVR